MDANQAKFQERLTAIAEDIKTEADSLLNYVSDSELSYRTRLQEGKCIYPIVPEGVDNSPAEVESLCAVDGALTVNKMYAADLMVASALFEEGKIGKVSYRDTAEMEPPVWAYMRPHESGNSVLVEAAMGMLEMYTITSAPHQYRILDGGFQTPLIGMRKALLEKRTEEIQKIAASIVLHPDFQPMTAAKQLYTPLKNRPIIALPKSDSDRWYVQHYAEIFELPEYHLADRMFATSMLQPGEMLEPRPVVAPRPVPPPKSTKTTVGKAHQALHNIVQMFENIVQERRAWTFYMKPQHSSTVIRVEFIFPDDTVNPTPQQILSLSQHYAHIVQSDTAPPHMLEPVCQWRVDDMVAKRTSIATTFLRQKLAENKNTAKWLIRDYRT